ncbi:arylesterase [Ramlibacter pinisoli]|uniref:Arylesterase n=1 Tax=Ramlibacter pinisoli TaxID=2682844 RepID=A0A6N8IMR5_9BURK|nr:arylesterase [Ramlibacter sp. CGMCC 1.13660]MVQ28149.1 arylesterase [Ramlibacter pinisoli]
MDRRDFIVTLAAALGAGALHAAEPATLLVVGDSLSAEYGLRRGTGWVALLEKRLAEQKLPVKVVNASISGDTTSGGRSRLAPLLAQHRPTHVAIELGANDALRGLPLAMTEDNLSRMTEAAQQAGARVLLVGIQLPPNYGADYGARFAALYEQVARRHKAAVVPFLLKGVADAPDAERLFQADRIHPTEQAQPTILENVWPELRKLLQADTGKAMPPGERKP